MSIKLNGKIVSSHFRTIEIFLKLNPRMLAIIHVIGLLFCYPIDFVRTVPNKKVPRINLKSRQICVNS